jgi:hypothetical protein
MSTANPTMSKAFVLSLDGKPLMPMQYNKAWVFIRQGKARLVTFEPLTVQLTYRTATEATQPVRVGIDDGARTAGVAVVVEREQRGPEVVCAGEIRLRGDTKALLAARRQRRRRRRRQKRHRQPRSRRSKGKGWLPPSVRVRKENILRVVADLVWRAPISRIVWEEGQFDTHRLVEPEVEGARYQQGPGYGWENRRHAVLFRDGYRCQYCGEELVAAGKIAEVDHVIPRSRGGTDTFENLVCACRECNQRKGEQTAAEFSHPEVGGRTFAYPAYLQSGKRYLREGLEQLSSVEVVFSWQTKRWRKEMGLEESHVNDAVAIAVQGAETESPQGWMQIVARRRRRNFKRLKWKEKWGLRHWDLVCYTKRGGRKVVGTVRGFVESREEVKVRHAGCMNDPLKAKRVQLLQRQVAIAYAPWQ